MIQELYSNLLPLFLLGLAVGCYGTLIGAGGGFLLVPIFLLFLKIPHEIAAGTSLAIVVANALSGTFGYMRQKKVDYRAGVIFAFTTVPGALGGVLLTEQMSGPLFMKVFGAFLLCISGYLFFRKPKPANELGSRENFNMPLGIGISLGVGVISSWFGIGGGILHVPAMVEVLKFPVHIAVATSQFILFWTALVGAITHGVSGNIDFSLAIPIGLGAITGGQLGALLAPKLKGSSVLRYLSLALLFAGLRLVFS